jgi:hypothetical protein
MNKQNSSASIPFTDEQMDEFAKRPEVVEYLDKIATFHYPYQRRMALNLLQYGMTIGFRLLEKAALREKEKRNEVINQDDWICEKCGKPNGYHLQKCHNCLRLRY